MPALPDALARLSSPDFAACALQFFDALGYRSAKTETLPTPDAAGFAAAFGHTFTQAALAPEWHSVQLLFQLTADEVSGQLALGGDDFDRQRFDSFLFFAVDLKGDSYTRTQLAGIARELNKPFPMPVIALFRYGNHITLASLHRRPNQRDERRDVLERVVLLKDIDLGNPHRAHVDILGQLADIRAAGWAEFLARWNGVLDISELNKRFFRELSDWYFNARRHCVFPKPAADAKSDDEHISTSLIRLITRVMFSYFLKERGLVPAALFDPNAAPDLLRDTGAEASTYYRAVLQNLFFATLNTEMGERNWKKPDNRAGYNDEFMVHNKRRYGDYFRDRAAAAALFDRVPFLNGGLFECLDKKLEKQTERYDGFSERADNPLRAPNSLFWGPDISIDLAPEYGADKPVVRTVKPLLRLFAAYKWTVAENTPLEEEVALDPELLGKVFENLLASYNPETKATARKQSGSFYTPREIVDYMVTESLVAYLGAQTDVEVGVLRGLFVGESAGESVMPASRPAQLPPTQTRAIIAAIEQLKLLDPAVGSGAFPMGALQSLVTLLRRIDPNNQLWRAQLETSARTLNVGSEGALEQIAEVWRRDGGDYARKLYLIENCLFGVDIQPIAIQIAKLRFFIALAIEQKGNDNPDDNFGIRPLPNLETKLVAANTLLELSGGQLTLVSDEVGQLQRDLEGVRHAHFKAQKWAKKKELREQDAALRKQLAEELKGTVMDAGAAELLASWNPYDQNASANFFDSRWMFGIDEGFDIIIGNPPYLGGRQWNLSAEMRNYFVQNYAVADYQFDMYTLFWERGIRLLKSGGCIVYVTPNTWLNNKSTVKLRSYILKNTAVNSILDCSREDIFTAVVLPIITMLERKQVINNNIRVLLPNKGQFFHSHFILQSHWETDENQIFNVDVSESDLELRDKIESQSVSLDSFADVKFGIKIYETGKGSPPQKATDAKGHIFEASTKKDATYRMYLEGKDIDRYSVNWKSRWLSYGSNLAAPRASSLFEGERLLFRRIVGKKLIGAYTDADFVTSQLLQIVKPHDQSKCKFLLGILNSSLTAYYFRKKYNRQDKTFPEIRIYELASLPIPVASAAQQAEISGLVEQILAARAGDAGADVSALEARIDALVYALYGLDDGEIALIEAA